MLPGLSMRLHVVVEGGGDLSTLEYSVGIGSNVCAFVGRCPWPKDGSDPSILAL